VTLGKYLLFTREVNSWSTFGAVERSEESFTSMGSATTTSSWVSSVTDFSAVFVVLLGRREVLGGTC
jgi:hypothetical protein